MSYPVVDTLTVTVSANAPEYVFQITLSDLGMDRLKHYSLLNDWIRYPKDKYRFLNDLAAALAEEIVKHFEQMSGAQNDPHQ